MSQQSRITHQIDQIPFGKTIIIAPLNWGMGHASRCIPIIAQALEQENKIIIASDGLALSLLRKEFPNLPYYELPAYKIKYPFPSILFNLFFQSFKIFGAMLKEKKAIEKIVTAEKADLLISDNRYGCMTRHCQSIFMTHQIFVYHQYFLIRSAMNIANSIMLKRYEKIWIPDYEGPKSLAGNLSQIKYSSITEKVEYLGPISRMINCVKTIPPKYDVLILLSGPEPQRTHLEIKLLDLLDEKKMKIKMIRGTNKNREHTELYHQITVTDVASTAEIQEALCCSKMVISRSGYSTVMDLYVSGSNAILIPTPGQTEQEYLAKYLQDKSQFKFINQEKLSKTYLEECITNWSLNVTNHDTFSQ